MFFAEFANASEWIEVYLFAAAHEEPLRKYLELPHGIPSHDTIQRVFAMVSPECLQEFRRRWNGNGGQKANHIVSAVDNGGFCIGEVLVDDKSNEITAIPEL